MVSFPKKSAGEDKTPVPSEPFSVPNTSDGSTSTSYVRLSPSGSTKFAEMSNVTFPPSSHAGIEILSQIMTDYFMASSAKKEEIKLLKPQETAFALGQALAQKAVKKNIKSAIFDRQKYQYHGRVKNIADGARTGGLKI